MKLDPCTCAIICLCKLVGSACATGAASKAVTCSSTVDAVSNAKDAYDFAKTVTDDDDECDRENED